LRTSRRRRFEVSLVVSAGLVGPGAPLQYSAMALSICSGRRPASELIGRGAANAPAVHDKGLGC